MLGLGPVFDVSEYELSHAHDIRPLVVKTILTYLELEGADRGDRAILRRRQDPALRPSQEILARFDARRAGVPPPRLQGARKGTDVAGARPRRRGRGPRRAARADRRRRRITWRRSRARSSSRSPASARATAWPAAVRTSAAPRGDGRPVPRPRATRHRPRAHRGCSSTRRRRLPDPSARLQFGEDPAGRLRPLRPMPGPAARAAAPRPAPDLGSVGGRPPRRAPGRAARGRWRAPGRWPASSAGSRRPPPAAPNSRSTCTSAPGRRAIRAGPGLRLLSPVRAGESWYGAGRPRRVPDLRHRQSRLTPHHEDRREAPSPEEADGGRGRGRPGQTVPDLIAPGLGSCSAGSTRASTRRRSATTSRARQPFLAGAARRGIHRPGPAPQRGERAARARVRDRQHRGPATGAADELSTEELVEGARRLEAKVRCHRPAAVAFLGITAYRTAFARRRAPPRAAGRDDCRGRGLGPAQSERPLRLFLGRRVPRVVLRGVAGPYARGRSVTRSPGPDRPRKAGATMADDQAIRRPTPPELVIHLPPLADLFRYRIDVPRPEGAVPPEIRFDLPERTRPDSSPSVG